MGQSEGGNKYQDQDTQERFFLIFIAIKQFRIQDFSVNNTVKHVYKGCWREPENVPFIYKLIYVLIINGKMRQPLIDSVICYIEDPFKAKLTVINLCLPLGYHFKKYNICGTAFLKSFWGLDRNILIIKRTNW
jgi:hypothetical protein